jgi:hypothetical protein
MINTQSALINGQLDNTESGNGIETENGSEIQNENENGSGRQICRPFGRPGLDQAGWKKGHFF